MTIRLIAGISLALGAAIPAVAAPRAPDRVLLVVSGHGADAGKTRPGFEMEELAQAYLVFAANGLTVDIASPAGGAVTADAHEPDKPYIRQFLADPAAMAKLAATRPLRDVGDAGYGAVFIIGGKGAMFDLPVNADLKALLAATHEAGGVVGAVCHGPAALINVPLAGGGQLAEGRRMTGFSNEEEALFGKKWAKSFPVRLEDGLRGVGARFSAAPMMLSHVVVDERLVTGQNPYSTPQAAEAVVRAMGRTVAARQPWADERSIALIGRILAGETAEASRLLAANPAHYDPPLIAMWGFYRAKAAGNDRTALAQAIAVMEIAQPHFPEPRLASAITEQRARLASLR
jgi:putative intracellular protease/amidase